MKKKILINFLIVSFLNYIGCYSYYTLSNEEINEGKPESTKNINLILNNGSEYKCVPPMDCNENTLCYLKVDSPGTYLIGIGNNNSLSSGITSEFKGVLHGDAIDSTILLTIKSVEYYSVWTKTNDWLLFKKGNYVSITPAQGTGYFLWSPNDDVRKVSFNDIKDIQEDNISWSKTTLFIVLSAAVIVGIGLILINESMQREGQQYRNQ